MQTFEMDGVELECEVAGTGESAVCIHGAFIADTCCPLATIPRLAGRSS